MQYDGRVDIVIDAAQIQVKPEDTNKNFEQKFHLFLSLFSPSLPDDDDNQSFSNPETNSTLT